MPSSDDSLPVTRPQPRVAMLVLNEMTHDSRVQREADALAAAGYQVTVIGTHDAASPLPDEAVMRGWRLRRLRYGRGWARLRGARILQPLRHAGQLITLARFLARQEADIWHAHDFPALLPVSLARQLARLRGSRPAALVYDVHDLYFHRQAPPAISWGRLTRRAGLWLESRLARQAAARITVSPLMADFLAAQWDTTPPVVVMNGADAMTGAPALTRPPGARLWLLHTGNLLQRGRLLPEILDGLALTPPDVHLTWLGDGPQQHALQQLTAQLGLSARVHFHPPVAPEDVCATIKDADAALVAFDETLPNYAVTLPNKLFEGIGAGLPILATHTPALARFWRDHPVGILWEASDPASFRQAVHALADPARRQHWQQAVSTAQEQIGWPAQQQKLLACYNALPITV